VMIHEIVAKFAAAIREPVRKFRRGRVEQDACGFQAPRTQKHQASLELERGLRLSIDYANRGNAPRVRIEAQAVHHTVRPDCEPPGLLGCGQRRIQAAEIRLRDATALAYAAVMAGGATFVHLRKNGAAANHQNAVVVMPLEGIANVLLDAGHFHRRQKFSIRQVRQAFGLPADSGKLLHVVVPRSDIFVANGPIDRNAFSCVGFEVEVAPAVSLASLRNGFAAQLAPADPRERLSLFPGVRVFEVVDKKLTGELVAVLCSALDFLCAQTPPPIVPVAEFHLPDRNVLVVVLLGNDHASGFEQEHVQAFFRQFLGSPAAGNPGTNDKGVVGNVGHGRFATPSSQQPLEHTHETHRV